MAEAVPPGKKYLLGERKSILLGEILDVWEMYLFRNSHQMRTFIGPKFGWVFFRNFSNHVVCVASDGRKPNQDHCLLPSQSLPGGGGTGHSQSGQNGQKKNSSNHSHHHHHSTTHNNSSNIDRWATFGQLQTTLPRTGQSPAPNSQSPQGGGGGRH